MAKRRAIGSLLRDALVFLVLLSFVFHLLPAGAKLCQEISGSVALEAQDASCCGTGFQRSDEAAQSDGCQSCVDFEISSDRNALPQDFDVTAVAGPVEMLTLIDVIAWPQPTAARHLLASPPARSPALQRQIASTVIRC